MTMNDTVKKHIAQHIDRGLRGGWGRRSITEKTAQRMKEKYVEGITGILADRTLLEGPIKQMTSEQKQGFDSIAAMSADPDLCKAYLRYVLGQSSSRVHLWFRNTIKMIGVTELFLDELKNLMQPAVGTVNGMRSETKCNGADILAAVDRALYRTQEKQEEPINL